MFKKLGCITLAVLTLLLSIPITTVKADEFNDLNTAYSIISKIDTFMPTEVEGKTYTGEEKPPLETFIRMGKYLYYVDKLDSFVSDNYSSMNDWVIESRDYHNKKQAEYKLVIISTTGNTYRNYIDYVITTAKEQTHDLLYNKVGNADSSKKADEYKKQFNPLKENIKAWSDSIRFLRDEVGITDSEFKTYSDNFDEYYTKINEINRTLGMDLNLGFIRPQDNYEEASTVAHNMLDKEGNLKSWFIEIFALSAQINGEPLSDYTHLLSENAKAFYEAYSKYRVPLYIGIDPNQLKALQDEKEQNIRPSNLREFLNYPSEEKVLYMPLYEEDKTKPNSITAEETTIDANKSTKYTPVYLKNEKRGFTIFDSKGVNDKDYQSASLNHMQFNNFYHSGKTNDYSTTDLAYPLFIDMWGNIQTYTGRIVIPAVSNMYLFKDTNYFALNAYFINNYPSETLMMAGSGENAPNEEGNVLEKAYKSIEGFIKPDPNKLAILVTNSTSSDYVGDLLGDTGEFGGSERYFQMVNLKKLKKGGQYKVGFFDQMSTINILPNIITYVESEKEGKVEQTAFLRGILTKHGISKYTIVGLKESAITIDDKIIPFVYISEDIPVEKWNYNHLYGKDGDKRKLDNDLIVKIAESCKANPDGDFAKLKTENSQKMKYGDKLAALFEPIHKDISEAGRNYVLYTPSVAELPGVNEYISVILIPVLKIALLIAVAFTLLYYVRHIKSMRLSQLAISIAIIVGVNFGITSLYPAILNTGFNGIVSKTLGKNGYYLTLYNIERDLNSKGEFVYGDDGYSEKLITDGAYIKIAELDADEVKAFRSVEERAPYKDSDYYIPQWDTSQLILGNQVFIQGTSLYVHIKDLTSSTLTTFNNGEYQHVWEYIPEYSYYMPYLSILEGVTKSVNKYISGRLTPKVLKYSTGYEAYTGGSLAYFSNKYFLVDNESARSDEEFMREWELYNGGDYLNLRNVLYLEADEQYFPSRYAPQVQSTRWYKTAVGDLTEANVKNIEDKIFNVNQKTKNFIIELLPYMDNLSDDITLKIIALYATVEFNKEFSKGPVESLTIAGREYLSDIFNQNDYSYDYQTKIFPQRLEYDTLSIDEHLKISLINVKDLLKFNVTSLYRFVENEGSWAGVLLLGLDEALLIIRSIMRITLITVTLVVMLMYMVWVYALRRDYANKTIVSLFGIVGMSMGVYLIDNILTVGFVYADKKSAGVLLLLLSVWLLWNIIGTAIYVLIFTLIFKDLSSFGGDIMYSSMTSVLKKINNLAKGAIGMVSKTRAENFDITRPDLEMKAKEFQEYLDMDFDDKLINAQNEIGSKVTGIKNDAIEGIRDRMPQGKTLKELYATHKSQGDTNMSVSSMALSTAKPMREYLKSYGLNVYQNPRTGMYTVAGDIDTWGEVVNSNMIREDKIEYYREKDGEIFIPNTKMSRDFITKAGLKYELAGNRTIVLDKNNSHRINEVVNALKTPVYKIQGNKSDVLNKIEGVLNPNEYEIGSNAVYLKDKGIAEKIFGENRVATSYRTQHKLMDYSDRVNSGYISDNLELNRGLLVSNEYIYGKIDKQSMRGLLDSGVQLQSMGHETYKFSLEDRSKVTQVLGGTTKFTEGREGVVYRDKSPLDNLLFFSSSSIKEEHATEGDNNEGEPEDMKVAAKELSAGKDILELPENLDKVSGIGKDLIELDIDIED